MNVRRYVTNPDGNGYSVIDDGIVDEVLPAGPGGSASFRIADWYYATTVYTETLANAGILLYDVFFPNTSWVFSFADGSAADYGMSPPRYVFPVWITPPPFIIVSTTAYANVEVSFKTEAGYTYQVYGDHSGGATINAANLIPMSEAKAGAAGEMQSVLLPTFVLSDLSTWKLFVVRFAKPYAATAISIGATTVSVGATGANAGPITVPLPNGGSATVNLGAGAGAVTLADGTVVGISSSGVITVNGSPVAIGGTTVGGVSLQVDTTGGTLTTQGGPTIHLNPNGSGTIALPSGAGINVASNGHLTLNLPPGSPQTIAQVVDVLNKVLHPGAGAAITVRDLAGVLNLPMPTSGVIGAIDAGITAAGVFQVGVKMNDTTTFWFDVVTTPPPKIAVDANRDGAITFDAPDATDAAHPYRFWLNDDDDNADSVADANDAVINGVADLDDFYPVFLDLKSLVAAMPPSSTVKYKLKQDDGAVNFVYTSLTRATAFSYVGGSLSNGFGPSFNQAASSATVQQVTATGVELSSDFLTRIENQDQGVILMEGRQMSDKPLVLQVEKDGSVVAETRLEMVAMHLGKLWDTANKANQIFNRTRKDDSTNAPGMQEVENSGGYAGPGYEAVYAAPRNNLYVVADPNDNKLKVSLDLGIPATSRNRFLVAAWDGTTKVTGSDAAFPADASQPANLQIAASANAETKEYRLKLGVDANGNGLLDDNEATLMEMYRRRDNNELRFATVKGISNTKYSAHRQAVDDLIHANKVGPGGLINLNEDPPTSVARYARNFLALFFYKGNTARVAPTFQPDPTSGTQQIDAFADGVGYAEWLTHNSGATFTDVGVATIKEYRWIRTSEVAEFFALRTPFALEVIMNNTQGYYELQTDTGAALKAFYNANVKTAGEQALQNSAVGTTMTFPLGGGWYSFPRAESPNLFRSISPGTWVPPSTQIVGTDDGRSGFGALFTDIVAGTDQFKDFDANGAIGRGRVLNPQYRITVKKEDSNTYKVSNVEFTCDIEDLYDFNYEDGTLPSHAAAMQIGWGKGTNGASRDQGVIYRHRINIDHNYDYPFDQAVIPYPP